MTTSVATVRRTRSGAVAFLAGSVGVHAGNYLFNLVAVRSLSPAEYADVALVVSLLLLAGFVTVGLQMATARTVAESPADSHSIVRWFNRRAFRAGLALGAGVIAGAPLLATMFRTAGPLPFLAVGVALPWAFIAGVGRGLAQGFTRFGRLALSFQSEMLVRLGMGAGLMAAGHGVAGAVGALAASLIAAALVVRVPTGESGPLALSVRTRLLAALAPSLALLVGEALVNHADTIIVKQAFDPASAGQFAAIALIGRTVFFVTWPVSMLAFPVAAGRAAAGQSTRPVLLKALGGVTLVGTGATAVAIAAPHRIVELVLGPEYLAQAHLLGPYVAATTLFAATATIASFAVAIGRARAGYSSAAFGFVVVAVLALFHPGLAAVVWAQVALNAVALTAAAVWVLRPERTAP